MKNRKEADVYWYLPHQKKCFATSTISTSELITFLAKDNMTVKDVYNSINYDYEAKQILKYFIDSGYEKFIMKDFVTPNKTGVYHKIEGNEIKEISRENLKKVLKEELNEKEEDLELEV